MKHWRRVLCLLMQPGYAWEREHKAQEFALKFPRFYPEYFACIMAYSWGR